MRYMHLYNQPVFNFQLTTQKTRSPEVMKPKPVSIQDVFDNLHDRYVLQLTIKGMRIYIKHYQTIVKFLNQLALLIPKSELEVIDTKNLIYNYALDVRYSGHGKANNIVVKDRNKSGYGVHNSVQAYYSDFRVQPKDEDEVLEETGETPEEVQEEVQVDETEASENTEET